MLLELKNEITYGPVRSRRLGRSLGINLFPGREKVCPFDCVYCQYGWTIKRTASLSGAAGLVSADAVEAALRAAMARLDPPPAFLTFSGNGEPTLHPELGRIIDRVKTVRDEMASAAKTALLSNSALVGKDEVREAILKLDVRIMKLDAGREDVFARYNRPHPAIDFRDVTAGLARLSRRGPLIIQSLLASGPSGNLTLEHLADWAVRLSEIGPTAVQIYTLSRGYPDAGLVPGSREELSLALEAAARRGLAAEIF
jgi:wyosine [tRNA(Phe)-imidazoG37] synthetase (radical SAM superfamily)